MQNDANGVVIGVDPAIKDGDKMVVTVMRGKHIVFIDEATDLTDATFKKILRIMYPPWYVKLWRKIRRAK